MKHKRIFALIFALLFVLAAAGCSNSADSASTVNGADTGSAPAGEHGRARSVAYSCADTQDPEKSFSFLAAEDDGEFLFSYFCYDADGERLEEERKIGEDDMSELRAVVERYGYSDLVGQRAEPDFGNDDVPDAPSYYLSIGFEDGKSMSADSAGDGGAELESFFRSLAEKED